MKTWRRKHAGKVVRAVGSCIVRNIRASRGECLRNCRKTIPAGTAFAVHKTDAGRERHRHRFDFYYGGDIWGSGWWWGWGFRVGARGGGLARGVWRGGGGGAAWGGGGRGGGGGSTG